MPRVRPLTEAQAMERIRQDFAKRIPCNVAYQMMRAGIRSEAAMVPKLKTMSKNTLYDRMKHPEKFTIENIADLAGVFNVTIEALLN